MFVYGWDLLTLNYISSLSFDARWNIFRFLDRGFDCLKIQTFKKNCPGGKAIIFAIFSLNFDARKHIFSVLER